MAGCARTFSRFLSALFVLVALAFTMSADGQDLSQLLSQNGGSEISSEIFRELQQRVSGQSNVPSLQPNVQVQNPPTYPSPQTAQPAGPLSSIERLMSERAGQVIRQFGYENFGHGSQVVVRQSGAMQDNYLLGEGDEIVLTLRGQQNERYRGRVDRDGRVVFPSLPPIAAAGRPFGDFRADIEATARQAIPGTEILVSVGAVRQIAVRVVGEVNAPGLLSLSGLATAMDALSLAGGIRNTGSLRNIQIIRGGKTVPLDLYAMLFGSARGADINLAEGDRIVVPVQASAVGVVGQVKRPAIYELPPGQASMPTDELLQVAGGTEVRGLYRLSILRTRADGRREMVNAGHGAAGPIRDGDILFVTPTADISLGKIKLMGGTNLNGYYPLSSVRTLRGLLSSRDMFAPALGRPLPYLLVDAVIRLDPLTMQRAVLPFSAVDVLEGKTDLPLQSDDIVYIASFAEMRYIAHGATEAQRAASRGRMVNDHPGGEADQGTSEEDARILAAGGAVQGSAPPELPLPIPSSRAAGLAALQAGQVPSAPPPSALPAALPAQQTVSPDVMALLASRASPAGPQVPRDAMPAAETPDTGAPKTEDERLYPGIDATQPADAPDTASGGLAAARRPATKLFVGLDEDTRRLLITTLSNYTVTLVGELNRPGDFLVMPHTSLDKLVQAAGGLTPKVDLHAFEITSAEIDNAAGVWRTQRKRYDLSVGQFAQVLLKPFDRIRFNPVFSDRDSGDVSVVGEVRSPGGYEILRGERLSSVLARAGGFTDAAYPTGTIFLRRSVAQVERGVMQREADALERQVVGIVGTVTNKTQVSDAEIQYVATMIARLRQGSGQGGGRIAVELDPAEIARHPELDVVVEPGDQVFVPRRPSSVLIAGEVMSPGGIQYRADRSVSTYVALAGGFTEIADDDHMFVIQPDGSAAQVNGGSWLSEPPTLAPGSLIVVPRRLRHFTWDTLFEDAIQVTSQLAITGASLAVISH